MIDINKPAKTTDGRTVINLSYVPYNSAGGKVTYPIKGTILNPKPKRPECAIWSVDGVSDVVWGRFSNRDISQ